LLALRRRGVDCRLHRRVHHRPLREGMTKDETTVIAVPAPMPWPLTLAMGVTLMFGGLLTHMSVTVLGAVLSLAGCVGWFREVVPGDHEEEVAVVAEDDQVATDRHVVDRLAIAPG